MSNELRFGLELPTSCIRQFASEESIHFCIANYVLSDQAYANAYRELLHGPKEEVIIDNGAYEAGAPLSLEDMDKAASLLYPVTPKLLLICADKPGSVHESLALTLEYRDYFRKAYPRILLGAVVQGNTLQEEIWSYRSLLDENFDFICLSFLWNRPEFLRHQPLNPHTRHHFLGCFGLEELLFIREHIPLPPNTSIDTAKPVKAAYNHQTLQDYQRAGSKWDPNATLTGIQDRYLHYNIHQMKQYCTYDTAILPPARYNYERPLTRRSDPRCK